MHLPTLGKYPLSPRINSDTGQFKLGELLCDYTNDKLYYINLKDGRKTEIARGFYEAINVLKIEKTHINIVKDKESLDVEAPVIPVIDQRTPNHFYFNIYESITV